jgi:hypothetical protein
VGLPGSLRRHWLIAVLLTLATLVRALVMVAYRPAFWYHGDSGVYVALGEHALRPHDSRALGYVVFLKLFHGTGTFAAVAAAQHLMGLLVAVGGYAFLVHRGLPTWLAGLAVVPVLFDSLELTLEHYLLTEALFTALLVAGVLLLLWRRPPRVVSAALAGLLLYCAWFTRPSTLPAAALLAGYLVFRRVDWRAIVAFGAAFAVPYAATIMWIGDRPSPYGESFTARALYSRTAIFADCSRLVLAPRLRALCPTEPLGQRPDRADWYGWNGPAVDVPYDDNAVLMEFAVQVIRQQPADYLAVVLRESAPHFLPGQDLGPGHRCLAGRWTMPATVRDTPAVPTHCHPELARSGFQFPYADPAAAPAATPLTRGLQAYARVVRTPALLVTASLLLVIVAVIARRRRSWADRADAVVLALIGLSLILLPVAVAMYDPRYGQAALPFLGLAGALAAHDLRAGPTPGDYRSEGSAATLAGAPDGSG